MPANPSKRQVSRAISKSDAPQGTADYADSDISRPLVSPRLGALDVAMTDSRQREATPSAFERHYTVKELAQLWRLDQSTVRRLFRDEPGVLRIPHLRRRGKRDYVSLRIPASVASRVHQTSSRGALA
jgi:hypothetical protein